MQKQRSERLTYKRECLTELMRLRVQHPRDETRISEIEREVEEMEADWAADTT